MYLFKPGKLTTVMDMGAGSSAKGLRAAYLWSRHRMPHTTFAVNTFMENAAHTVTLDDGTDYVFQCLASITPLGEYQKQYLSPGCVFAAKTVLGEIARHELTPERLGIHPNAAIVSQADVDYEAGLVDFEGRPNNLQNSPNLKIGSTLHGVGATRARRILRRPEVMLAKDVPELGPFLCDTAAEIVARLRRGESGLLEIAQGYQLSLYSRFYPRTTSRNCSVAAALDDALLPVVAAGPLVANFRTFPIRVNSNKYVRTSDGAILTWDQYRAADPKDVTIIHGDSGGCYPDQEELTWDQVSEMAGTRIVEMTSLTKLPRRVFTFSPTNLVEGLTFNNTGDDAYLSINFMNYVDQAALGKRTAAEAMTPKVSDWLARYVRPSLPALGDAGIDVRGLFLGTGRHLGDSVFVEL